METLCIHHGTLLQGWMACPCPFTCSAWCTAGVSNLTHWFFWTLAHFSWGFSAFLFLLLFPQIPTFWKTIAGFSSFLFLKSLLPLHYLKQHQRGNIFLWSPFPAFATCRQEIIYSKSFQISSLRHSRYIKSVVQSSDCSGVQLTAEPTWKFSNALKTSSPVSSLFTRY